MPLVKISATCTACHNYAYATVDLADALSDPDYLSTHTCDACVYAAVPEPVGDEDCNEHIPY